MKVFLASLAFFGLGSVLKALVIGFRVSLGLRLYGVQGGFKGIKLFAELSIVYIGSRICWI